jgi:dolichyl-phosphate-mannose-protein mannosyltransferase
LIPRRHTDGKVSSNGQQVNAYGHSDKNSIWEIQPVDQKWMKDEFEVTKQEEERGIRYLRANSKFRLRHIETGSFLATHDVASPLTNTNMEVTAWNETNMVAKDETEYSIKYNQTVWMIDFKRKPDSTKKLMSKRDEVSIINPHHIVALKTQKESLLPDWGFKMQEINGNKKLEDSKNLWKIVSVVHENIINGLEKGESPEVKHTKPLSFIVKFLELQLKMIHHNSNLKKAHPYGSTPIGWPFVLRGISFWEKNDGLKQIYLLGNPIAWWISITGPLLYITMWVLDRLFLQRGVDDMGIPVRNWWDRSLGFLTLCWAMHYLPFFLMGRMLFLHHYLPAYIFSSIQTAVFFDFIGRDFGRVLDRLPSNTRMRSWRYGDGGWVFFGFVLVCCVAIVGGFSFLSPLCYGLGFPTVEAIRAHKLFKTWDFQYA